MNYFKNLLHIGFLWIIAYCIAFFLLFSIFTSHIFALAGVAIHWWPTIPYYSPLIYTFILTWVSAISFADVTALVTIRRQKRSMLPLIMSILCIHILLFILSFSVINLNKQFQYKNLSSRVINIMETNSINKIGNLNIYFTSRDKNQLHNIYFANANYFTYAPTATVNNDNTLSIKQYKWALQSNTNWTYFGNSNLAVRIFQFCINEVKNYSLLTIQYYYLLPFWAFIFFVIVYQLLWVSALVILCLQEMGIIYFGILIMVGLLMFYNLLFSNFIKSMNQIVSFEVSFRIALLVCILSCFFLFSLLFFIRKLKS